MSGERLPWAFLAGNFAVTDFLLNTTPYTRPCIFAAIARLVFEDVLGIVLYPSFPCSNLTLSNLAL
jgi:hypothetical protein